MRFCASKLGLAGTAALLGCVAFVGLALSPTRALAQAAFTSYSTYDTAHRLLGTVGLSAQSAYPATRYTYDSYGRLSLVETGYIASWQGPPTLPSAWTGFTVVTAVSTSYDAYGRKIQTETASGGAPLELSQITYDAYGRVSCEAVRMNLASPPAVGTSACTLGTTGSNGPDRINQHNYDSLNRVTSELRAVGTAQAQTYATYTYGADSEQTSVADANGNLTTTIYDGFDRVSQVEYPSPSNGTVSNTSDYDAYGYDAQSNMISHRLRDGNVMSIAFDALNRKTSESVAGAAPVYITYDLLNRPTMYAPSPSATMDAITYDKAGRITGETTGAYPMTYAYDADGDRTQITYFDGNSITYAYNAADQLTTVQSPQSTGSAALLASYTYDAMGRRIGVARGSGTTTAYGYDGLSRLSSLSHSLSTTNPTGNQTYGLGYTPSSQINALSTTNGAYLWAASSGAPSFDGEFNALSLWNGSTGVWATNYGFGGNPDSVAARTLPGTGEVELYVDALMTGTGTTALGLNPYSLSGGVLDLHAGPTPAADLSSIWGYKFT